MATTLMPPFFLIIKERYATAFHERGFAFSFIISFAFLFFALVVNYFAALYAIERASSAVADIILSNIPVFDVDLIFIYGPLVFSMIIICTFLYHPKTVPFAAKSIALFVIIRSLFIMLTHLGPFPDHVVIDNSSALILNIISANPNFFLFSTGADLFFSGHTGLPFMLAFIFWKNLPMRIFCLGSSVFFGIIVLLGHLHYSIDVASAFFISYTIYIIATHLFKKDYEKLLTAL